MIVLDSSAAIEYLVGRPNGEWVEAQLEIAGEAHAVHLVDVEVMTVLRKLVQRKEVSRRVAERALDDLEQMKMTRYPHVPLLPRMWELRENVTSSDAAFVVLAEALALPLVTTDYRLARAPGLSITILTP